MSPARMGTCPFESGRPGPPLCELPLLDTLLENTDSQLAYLDRDFTFVRVNSAYVEGCGHTREELIGRNHFELFPNEENRTIFARVRDTGEPVRFLEKPFEFADQPERGLTYWDWTLTPVCNPQGVVDGLVLSLTDVTAQVRARLALKEADRRKDEFLALLAHELRNPLAPLVNAAQILRHVRDAEAKEEAVKIIERQVWHMVRLIDDLLDVSRITRGAIQLRKERVDLALIIQSAAAAVRPAMEARQHQFTVSGPSTPVLLHVDPTRLTQVLANLLNNAARYTPPGGQIWLTAAKAGGQAVIRVRDNGAGLSDAARSRLFQMFSRAESEPTGNKEGLGVGLALARKLTELHDGTIEAHSEGEGQGSEFVVRLPVGVPEEPAAAQPAAEPDPSGHPLRILVVDDVVDSARSLGQLLELMGHEVWVGHDGPGALEIAGACQPDVAILDIGLPGMDGYEVARRLRKLRVKLLLIALTGWGQEEDCRRAEEAGFNHHLVKPVKPAELEEMLTAFVETREPPA